MIIEGIIEIETRWPDCLEVPLGAPCVSHIVLLRVLRHAVVVQTHERDACNHVTMAIVLLRKFVSINQVLQQQLELLQSMTISFPRCLK